MKKHNKLCCCFCAYQMLYHLSSNDPTNYGSIKFRSSINTMNSVVMYRISSVSTMASFSMTTDDDYLIIETTAPINKNEEEEEIVIINEEEDIIIEEETTNEPTNQATNEQTNEPELIELRFQFHNHGAYDIRTLAYTLNTLMTGQLVSVNDGLPIELNISMDSTNRLIMTANKEFSIKEASHGARLLLGLYHSTLPISSTQKQILMPSVPYVSYGNILYLTARTDFLSVVNVDNKEITRSIAYKLNELLYSGYPINCKIPGNWSIIHSDQLSSLEFQLVDFQLVPVVLHAPMYITLEIESLSDSSFLPKLNDRRIDLLKSDVFD